MGVTKDNYKPYKIEPRCHVCMSELRPFVDKLAAFGYRPAAIARNVQDIDPTLSRKSIERHIERHLELEQRALREIIERRATEEQILDDELRSQLVTKHAVLDAIVSRAWQQISDPNQKVYFKDALQAIEIQSRLEDEEVRKVADAAMAQLRAIIQAIKEIVPAEYWPDVVARARDIYDTPLMELPEVT